MVELHFQKYLTNEKIEGIKQKYEFRDKLPIEKFIMDFEVLTHIQKELPDCVVKGGMAVPFHIQEKSLRRLSVDIDIVTGQSEETVIKAMKKIAEKLKGMVEIPSNHIPAKKNNKKLPLLTYYCKYRSLVDDSPEIKIEIFYGNQLKVKTKLITNNEEIIGVPIDFPLSIFDHGALIGDKLTTLPFNTIGMDSEREHDIPKQIYDIANLLKSTTSNIPIQEIIETFELVSREEISYYIEDQPSIDEILDDLIRFPDGLLQIENQIKLNPSYEGKYDNFRTEVLSGSQYKKQIHVIDILLVKILTLFIRKKIKNKIEFSEISKKLKEILSELSRISTLSGSEKNKHNSRYCN